MRIFASCNALLLSHPLQEDANLLIFDILGKIAAKGVIPANEREIKLPPLGPNGVYIVKVVGNRESATGKIVLVR